MTISPNREFLKLCEVATHALEGNISNEVKDSVIVDGEILPKATVFNDNNMVKPAIMLMADKMIELLHPKACWDTIFIRKADDAMAGFVCDSMPKTNNWFAKMMCTHNVLDAMSDMGQGGLLDLSKGMHAVTEWVNRAELDEGQQFKASDIHVDISDITSLLIDKGIPSNDIQPRNQSEFGASR